MSDKSFFITLIEIELMIPCARSLKEKRSKLQGLKEQIRQKHNASVAEIGYQEKWQRAAVAVCLVGTDKRQLMSVGDRIHTLCEQGRDIELLDFSHHWL
ncbi:DUF503 domain-containing protein [Thalassomonas actiniarum]|uniref:DUF503 domain-containing protein n=1 Tax=Thalassomonas actiniarum TaxID=485447 RepID=A0AAE9YXF6_9GAMM|nr:DUF503 domain-containing protein [Thalassomonas actiniarum]WDE02688.1 DUF503 domain-containing protein [Thalassomonas actiniarum]